MRTTTRVQLLAALALFLPALSSHASPPGPAGRWRVVFQDDFDGTSLDLSKWSYHYPWSRVHNHLAYSRSENVAVREGKLVLTALEESYGGKPYTTGVVNSSGKFHTTYGYIEARLKMPSSLGSWPAFWMLQSGWPPEIDIMEFPLSDTSRDHNEKYRYWWNYHWGTVSDHRSAGSEEWVSSDLTAGFHEYAVEWFPDGMRFYFDGQLRGEVADRAAIAESAGMYLILNYAVGGWPGDPPSWPPAGDTYEIDWVRAWQPDEPAASIDLGNIVGGGDGLPTSQPPHVGIHPATGQFGDDLGLDGVSPAGANPDPVASSFIDSVFLMAADLSTVNTKGTRYAFPARDSSSGSWDLISNVVESDGPPGVLRLGSQGVFTRGIGIHAASGVTFDLEGLRRRHGSRKVAFFSAFAGEGSLQAGGSVNAHVLLADSDGRLLHAVSTGPHTDGGRFVELELPLAARFLTLAVGTAGDGNGQDHGVFANAAITPSRVSDPSFEESPPEEVLSFSGSTWSYLDGGAVPPSSWTSRSFVATGWKEGRAELGYGDGDEATTIGFGAEPSAKAVTAYFRRRFAVSDAAGITGLSLWLLRDDGAVVYLNGTEVLRSNLPSGAVGASTLAVETIDGDAERAWVVERLDPCLVADGLLVEGTNVIAVEVHQASRTSSDVSFDLVIAADRDPEAQIPCGTSFLRGDCNGDADTGGVSDAIFLLSYSFTGGTEPPCRAACDVNGDGDVGGVTDAIYQLAFAYLGGPAPVEPFPLCGPESLPTERALECATPPTHCQ
jgi:beta-glucanase (GH16 family)